MPKSAALRKSSPATSRKPDLVKAGALPAEALKQEFPPIALPIKPPFLPAEAKQVHQFSSGSWAAGAYIDDRSGAFAYCYGAATYQNSIIMSVVVIAV